MLKYLIRIRSLRLKITDEGKGFIPEEVPDPTIPKILKQLNGRGIFLMSGLLMR